MNHRLLMVAALLAAMSSLACVRRTVSITTQPTNALVFLNDQEIGRSEVSTDFLWYGDYDVTIRKEGYETLHTNRVIKAPWYQWVPIDFFFEVLWVGHIHDSHAWDFELEPRALPDAEALIERAVETRERAFDPRG